jgi:hypothetical protein
LERLPFPFKELQTNGLKIGRGELEPALKKWRELGLNTIAISVAHIDYKANKKIFTPNGEYIPLADTVEKLKSFGYTVRLCVMGYDDGIDSFNRVDSLIKWGRGYDVDQITYRRIMRPDQSADPEIARWVEDHFIDDERWEDMQRYVDTVGTLLLNLPHGAKVYDIDGQNFCISTCLTDDPDPNNIRQVIYFPDGHLRYSWQHKGAILL